MSVAAIPLSAAANDVVAGPQDIRSQFDAILTEVPQNHFYSAANMRSLLNKYTTAELELIHKDFLELREQTFAGATKQLSYIVTAGGPGAGKSTALESLLQAEQRPPLSIRRAYIDPDRTCLLKMQRTYLADTESHARSPQKAYEHWREASNFLSNVFLAIGLKEGYAIAHGSTMATPYAKNALTAIKNQYGYNTTIMHLTCDEDIRIQSEKQRRDSGVVQCTDQDFKDKNVMFFSLLGDYLQSADNVFFYYRGVFDRATFAAKVKASQGEVTVYDEHDFAKIKEMHDAAQGRGFWKKTFEPDQLPSEFGKLKV